MQLLRGVHTTPSDTLFCFSNELNFNSTNDAPGLIIKKREQYGKEGNTWKGEGGGRKTLNEMCSQRGGRSSRSPMEMLG